MFKQVLGNRYAALIWVAITLFSAAAFVGDGGGKDQLDAAAKRFQEQQQPQPQPRPEPTEEASAEPEADLAQDPTPTIEPDAEDPQMLNGPNGERYRVLTPEEAAQVNPAEAAEQQSVQ